MSLNVTQNINKFHITAVQNNQVVKLQPIINTVSPEYIETDPIFQASEASLFVTGDKVNLDNQSGVNTGDETTSSIQAKRPIKTINGESLEGSGNVQVDYNDLDNLPTIPTVPNFAGQTEVNDGIVGDEVIAPNTLAGWWTYVKGLAQTFAQKITFSSGALFSPQVAPTYERGRIYFDNANDCISFMDSISGTSVQVGYEVLMRARNNTGATIPNGSVVYISGAIGQNSTVALAQANTLPTSEIIGIATHDIANNTVGKICVFGLVNDLNTSSFTDGQMIYLSATVAGGLTSTIPASPNFVVALGVVEHAHPTQGKILVRPQRALSNNNSLGTAQNVPPTQNAVKNALDLKLDKSTTPSSVYGTDASGEQTMIPVSEFKDVLEFANLGSFPATGESGKIYLALDTNLQYRWSGSAYVQIGGASENFKQSTWMFSDFVDENVNQRPFTGTALLGGTKDAGILSNTEGDYIGSHLIVSGTSANGGYRYVLNTNPAFVGLVPVKGLCFFGIFKLITQSDARDRVIRIGFHNSTNHEVPTLGAYLEILGSTATFKTVSSSVETASSSVALTSGAQNSGIFYKILIEFISTTSVNCKLVDTSGSVVLNVNHTTNIPPVANRFGCGLVATITTAGVSNHIMTIDYMGVGRQKPNFLNNF